MIPKSGNRFSEKIMLKKACSRRINSDLKKRAAQGAALEVTFILGQLDRKNLNDPHSARFDNDDLIVEHEIQIVTPTRLDPD